MKRIIAGAVLAGVLGLSACGGGGGGDPVAGGAGPAEPAPVTSAGPADAATGAPGDAAGSTDGAGSDAEPGGAAGKAAQPSGAAGKRAGGGGGPVASIPKQLCAFLKGELPQVKESGSDVRALAGFAVDYADWITENPERAIKSTRELDAITTSTCPKVRTQILKVLDQESFAKALG